MKKFRFWILLLVLLVIAAIVFDSLVAVRPAMPPSREGDPEPARPLPGDEPFHTAPIAATFAERRQLYYDWVLGQSTSDERGGVWTDIVKLAGFSAPAFLLDARFNACTRVSTRLMPENIHPNS